MVKRCFVFNCGTGRKSNRNNEYKFSLFKAPNDAVLLEKWRRSVPIRDRELNSNDRICEKHFEKRYILPRFQQAKYGDFYEDHIRPKLAPDAVPTIFESPGANVITLKSYKNLNGSSVNSPSSFKLVLLPVEVHETDTVPICYSCLMGNCGSHKVFQSIC